MCMCQCSFPYIPAVVHNAHNFGVGLRVRKGCDVSSSLLVDGWTLF